MKNKNLQIPIKNIYYMLCYAWNIINPSDPILVGSEQFETIYNLFATIYLNGTSSIIKQGIPKYYHCEKNDIATIRGKICISESIPIIRTRPTHLICESDELSENTLLNQVVKKTMDLLVKCEQVEIELKNKLKQQMIYFKEVEEITLSKHIFSMLKFNYNPYYKMLIHISQLLYEGLIVCEQRGHYTFSNFIRDKQMAKLFEKFVLNFYKQKLQHDYYVHSPKIQWKLDEIVSEQDLSLLPEMRTDIVIENKKQQIQFIIDTKYYSQTLVNSYWSEKEKIRSSHIYQLLTYVNSSKYKGEIKGFLLYPTIEQEIDKQYSIHGKKIGLHTINLNDTWDNIEKSLLYFVQ